MREASEHTAVVAYASIERRAAPFDATAESAGAPTLVEVKLLWGGDVLAVRHVRCRPRSALRVRDLQVDIAGASDLVVAGRDDAGELSLRLPSGVAVPRGCRMKLRLGRGVLQLTLVEDDAVVLPRKRPDPRVALGVLLAAGLHLALLALAVQGRAGAGVAEDAAREDLERMVRAAEERALGELAAAQERPRLDDAKAGSIASRPDESAAGNPAKASDRAARARITRGEDRRARLPERPAREEVASFGLLGLLGARASDGGRGEAAGSSVFAAESGPAAMGTLFGQTIDDAAGLGGLGLSGSGQGGGGHGAGVALGRIGTLGRAEGTAPGIGSGQGHCVGCSSGRHASRSPGVFESEASQISGRLPPESVQRVVRQSFGRIRGCYARGLEQRPDLEGRIVVKFAIDREGTVALASAAERDLDDASVARCVVRAFETMSFPRPVNGIVTVVYPIVFTRTGP